MPELPEVETIRRGLEPVAEGATILEAKLRRKDLRFPLPHGLAARLRGRKILALARRAKYLLFHLDSEEVLVVHLGMSGSFRVAAGAPPANFHHPRSRKLAHDHVILTLRRTDDEKVELIYNDPRRFGFMLLVTASELADHPAFARLGIEPTGNRLNGAWLAARLAARRVSLKSALMDQRIIAGLGNIYVCEALWRAGLSPFRPAGTIAGEEGNMPEACDRLSAAIVQVIGEAIDAGGSTLRDFMHADGELGYFQHRFNVYDREGQPCPRTGCTGIIRRDLQAGRSTFHCPSCQK